MSGKTSSSLSARSFYGESPPKRSRLQESTCNSSSNSNTSCSNSSSSSSNSKVNPAFKVLKDNLIKFDRKLSESGASLSCVKGTGGTQKPTQEPNKKPDQDKNTTTTTTTTSPSSINYTKRSVSPPTTTKITLEQAEPKDLPVARSSSSSPVTYGPIGNSSLEQKNLDRDSPLPLKNLGNTCYENSIIQCLFSLNTFMDNFETSMIQMRDLVVSPKETEATTSSTASSTGSNILDDEPLPSLNNGLSSTSSNGSGTSTISENDVRYRIADAFDKLYKSYTKKRIQIENSSHQAQGDNCPQTHQTNDSTQASLREAAEQDTSKALPLCKPPQSQASGVQSSEPSDTLRSNTPSATITTATSTTSTSAINALSNLTPIALVSPTATSNEQSEIETRLEDLKSAVGERSSQFNSTHQQDASEFFYHVIDSIQEFYQSLNKDSDDDNPVTKAFELELDYLIKCPKCHHKIMSTEPEKIRTLPLALPHVNNETLKLDDYTASNGASTPSTSDSGFDSPKSHCSNDEPPHNHHRNGSDEKENQEALVDEIMPEDNNSTNTMSIAKLDLTDKTENNHLNKRHTLCDALNNYFKDDLLEYSCSQPGCDSKHRTKKCLIRKLPQILFITLARYSYTGKKNLDEIEAPFELSVPFWENKSPSHHPLSAHRNLNDDDEYQLVAVVCHLGSSLNAGHYTSYVYNRNNLSWYSCDDDSITKVQEDDVKNDARKTGYCFFYAHKSC